MGDAVVVVGSIVQASGEAFVRKVVAIDGARARCERMPSHSAQWFRLDDLRLVPLSTPMRPFFT